MVNNVAVNPYNQYFTDLLVKARRVKMITTVSDTAGMAMSDCRSLIKLGKNAANLMQTLATSKIMTQIEVSKIQIYL